VGVSGTGPVGVRGDGTKRGVVGKGPVGISGEGTDVEVPGIRIIPADVGVNGKGPVGVRGESDVDSDRAIGVQGTVKRGTGIVGQSEEGNAGSFSSKRLAQIHLAPLSIPTPVGTVPGKGGDLLATKDLEGSTTLWFCVGDGDATTAVWKQIASQGTPPRD